MRKAFLRYVLTVLMIVGLLAGLAGCASEKTKRENLGGSNTLSLLETDDTITLENGKVRLVLNANSGSIRELANKEAGLYLTRDAKDSIPVRLLTATETVYRYDSFTYQVEQDTQQTKSLRLIWTFSEKPTVTATVTLDENSDQLRFRVALERNTQDQTAISVEYPIIEGIDTLKSKESDYFLSPFITGYLFQNPVDNFNQDFYGITRQLGEYPSGWGYPMQFSAYFSEGLGGFYWQTTDGGDTVKSFTMTGDDGKLRMSLYHYLNDISDGDKTFDYDVVFSNMMQGNWYEAANRYRDWAVQQSWAVDTGLLKDRTDVDLSLYEETTLTLFGLRVDLDWADYPDIYDLLKGTVDGKFLNVAIYKNNTYMDRIERYGDLLNIFEFSSLCLTSAAENLCDYYSTAMMNAQGEKETFTIHYYECAAEQAWREYALSREEGFIANYGVDGFYYDVDIAADHPKLCYDTTHSHGTRVNVHQDFVEQIEVARALSETDIPYTVGTEMITEQLLPYVNYYQARANSGLLGWMEHDRIRTVLENGSAIQIPLFDYVYHAYGIVRTDGYLTGESSIGDGFYYVAAYTVLNGGIPEINYEYYPQQDLPGVEDMNLSYLEFLNSLGSVRTDTGKDFLVYGQMMPVPQIDAGTTVYDFHNLNYNPYSCVGLDTLSGQAELPNVVASAWQNGDSNAVFLCNTSSEMRSVTLTLNAGVDFGVDSGEVMLDGKVLCEIKKGVAEITLELEPYQVIMLTF